MTITEILNTIHEERVELEIYQALQQWILDDRNKWIDRATESEATVRAVKNIATRTTNLRGALEGIVALCAND